LKKCLDSLATSGVPLYSTEFDMSGNDSVQLYYYKSIFPIIWEHPAIKGVTLWGWTDSWLLRLSTPKDARLIINGKERPALTWLKEYVATHKGGATAVKHEQRAIAEPSMKVDQAGPGEFRINLCKAQSVSVTVATPGGRTIISQAKRSLSKGVHVLALPLHACGNGLYIATLKGDFMTVTKKMVVE
jgi:hypothetical protein